MEEFTITEDHLKLLKHMNVRWCEDENSAPFIDPKSPYGNSYMEDDMFEIFGWEKSKNIRGELIISTNRYMNLRKLHRETETALQICLVTGKFETGTFVKTKSFSKFSWEKKS